MTGNTEDEIEETELLILSNMTAMTKSRRVLVANSDNERRYSPEKVLLLAVLEMAVRDLRSNNTKYVAQEDKRNAIAWIEGTISDARFTFNYIVSELGLSSSKVDHLKKVAEYAKKKRPQELCCY